MRVWRPAHPAKPRPPHQRRNTVPTTAIRRSTRAKTTRRAPPFKTIGMEGKTEPPTEPRVNTEIRRPTRAAELEPKHVLVAIQCRPVRQEHATGCNSMQDRPASGTPPGCSGETCSLSGETKASSATATRASCHEARHNRRSLPHCRRRVSSGGALLSYLHSVYRTLYIVLSITHSIYSTLYIVLSAILALSL